jgi:thiamine biosynthesis lipoprotein
MPGYHHVEHVMGMAVSIDVHDDIAGVPGLVSVVDWLHHVDRAFSTYRTDSPISRLGRGELSLGEVSDEVRGVLLQCEELRADTGGAFDALAVPGPNGTMLDPSGLVKGWAIERAAALLEDHGCGRFCINAGGDIALRGAPFARSSWRVGIRDPNDAEALAAVLELRGPVAVATSATYERGAHIIDPHTGEPTTEVASVTIVGPDLGVADAYATAVFVMGLDGIGWLASHPAYDGLILTHDGCRLSTPGMGRWTTGARAGVSSS